MILPLTVKNFEAFLEIYPPKYTISRTVVFSLFIVKKRLDFKLLERFDHVKMHFVSLNVKIETAVYFLFSPFDRGGFRKYADWEVPCLSQSQQPQDEQLVRHLAHCAKTQINKS